MAMADNLVMLMYVGKHPFWTENSRKNIFTNIPYIGVTMNVLDQCIERGKRGGEYQHSLLSFFIVL